MESHIPEFGGLQTISQGTHFREDGAVIKLVINPDNPDECGQLRIQDLGSAQSWAKG